MVKIKFKFFKIMTLVISLLTIFDTKSEDINWIPQICSVNGLQVVFNGANLITPNNQNITLNGIFHISTRDWMENAEYSVNAPIISNGFPNLIYFTWYSKVEKVGYKINKVEIKNISDSYFNSRFHKDNILKLQFCIGLNGTLYLFVSNGEERFLHQKIIAEKVKPEEINKNIDFLKMSNLLENRLKVKLNEVFISKKEFEDSIQLVKKIIIKSKEIDKLFLKLHFVDKQIIVIDKYSLEKNNSFPFPVAIHVYDKNKNLIKRIDFSNEFEKYGLIEEQELDVDFNVEKNEVNLILSNK